MGSNEGTSMTIHSFILMTTRVEKTLTLSAREAVLQYDADGNLDTKYVGNTVKCEFTLHKKQEITSEPEEALRQLLELSIAPGNQFNLFQSGAELKERFLETPEELRNFFRVRTVFGPDYPFLFCEASSAGERAALIDSFELDASCDEPLVSLVANDGKIKVAAFAGADITGKHRDYTGTLRTWVAPEDSIMRDTIRTRFPAPGAVLSNP
jgi:hypothetical protein